MVDSYERVNDVNEDAGFPFNLLVVLGVVRKVRGKDIPLRYIHTPTHFRIVRAWLFINDLEGIFFTNGDLPWRGFRVQLAKTWPGLSCRGVYVFRSSVENEGY